MLTRRPIVMASRPSEAEAVPPMHRPLIRISESNSERRGEGPPSEWGLSGRERTDLGLGPGPPGYWRAAGETKGPWAEIPAKPMDPGTQRGPRESGRWLYGYGCSDFALAKGLLFIPFHSFIPIRSTTLSKPEARSPFLPLGERTKERPTGKFILRGTMTLLCQGWIFGI